MSIQALQGQVQSDAAYQIHKRTEVHDAGQVQAEQSVQEVAAQSDEYDKANPVGEEAEGIYSVTYDSDGEAKVKYTQPAAKSGSEGAQASEETASTSSSDDTEEEIEKLKKQRDQIRQQLNKEQDENVKKSLRAQLQAIEAQIAQKTAQLQQ